jgi:hypothetical protein
MHIHVGNSQKGFTFDTLNLYALLWTFEPQIQEIHPLHRTENNTFYQNLRTNSTVARKHIKPGQPLARTGLDILLADT